VLLEEHTSIDADVEAERKAHLETIKEALQAMYRRLMVLRLLLVKGISLASNERLKGGRVADALPDKTRDAWPFVSEAYFDFIASVASIWDGKELADEVSSEILKANTRYNDHVGLACARATVGYMAEPVAPARQHWD
jgi:hypothetical protein